MKNNSSLKVSFLFLVICATFPLRAQQFDSLLNILHSKYPQEKLYLQFDKSVYNAGETIWFKAYIFAGTYPSLISKTLYAELLDEHGKVVQRKTAPIVISSAAASFDLSPDIRNSTMYIRAYTKWMLNFDSSFLYVKPILVIPARDVAAKQAPIGNIYLQFFPEGGDLVEGIESRIAFKATDGSGVPISVSGEVQNSKGKNMVSFSSVHDGMGYFYLVPDAEIFKAIWKDENGRTHETFLPQARKDGVVLEANLLGDKIQFSVRRPGITLTPGPVFFVVAQTQHQLLYRARSVFGEKTAMSGLIPTENLPAGIVHITVFTEDKKPVAERIVFINHQDYSFTTDLKTSFRKGRREMNVIQIDVPDTLLTNLSVAVTDASINPRQEGADDIFSQILLASDIKGYVHRPAYYFSGDGDSIVADLDLVMMTNGWRRFKWEDLIAGRWPTIRHLPEDYLTIEGNVSGVNKSKLANKNLTAILQMKNGNRQFLNISVQPDGKFAIPGMMFFDTARMYYQFNKDDNKVLTSRASFDFKTNMSKEPLRLGLQDYSSLGKSKPDSAIVFKNREISRLYRVEEKKVQTLATVEVKAKQKSKKEKMEEEYTSGFFSGDGSTFVLEDDPFANSSGDIFIYLQGKIAGLFIGRDESGPILSWRGDTPALFLDEMQGDAAMIQSIPISDVAMIKVFRPPFYGGFRGGSGGAIAIYTKKGASKQNVQGLNFTDIYGYSPVKQFYSPDYSKADQTNTANDYRTTLYWMPFVITQKDNRRIFLTFYNNDITKRIRVVLEGCNEDGKLTRVEKVFE